MQLIDKEVLLDKLNKKLEAATDTKLDYLDINDQLYCYNCGASMAQEF